MFLHQTCGNYQTNVTHRFWLLNARTFITFAYYVQYDELLKEHELLKQDIKQREEAYQAESVKSFECVICFQKLRKILLLPCKHLSVCRSCYDIGVERNADLKFWFALAMIHCRWTLKRQPWKYKTVSCLSKANTKSSRSHLLNLENIFLLCWLNDACTG